MSDSQSTFDEVRLWIHRNARALELAQWRYFFEGGSQQAVLDAMTPYQNADGGFGHRFESDNWNPLSTPYATSEACGLLARIGCLQYDNEIWQGIFRYLRSGAECGEHGWNFSVASNDGVPCSPWFKYDPEGNQVQNIGMTALVCAVVLRACAPEEKLYHDCLTRACSLMDRLLSTDELGDMGPRAFVELLDACRDIGVPYARFDEAGRRLHALAHDLIEQGLGHWERYGVRPSLFVETPGSPFYAENRDTVERELQYLLDTRPEDDVWGIPWTWFDLTPRYATQFAVSEHEWKASKAIEKMRFLRAFGRA